MIDDDTTNGDGHKGTFTHRLVAAGGPVDVPPGAVSSPFAMARLYAGDRLNLDQEEPEPPAATPPAEKEKPIVNETPARRGRGPGMVTRAKDTLKACGPLTVEQLAEGLGMEIKQARTLAKNGIQKRYWKREQIDGSEKLVLAGVVGTPRPEGQSGLKRYLSKRYADGPTSAEKPSPAKGRAREPKAPAAPIQPANLPAVTPTSAPRAQFGLFNTGVFHIVYDGQELKLPREVTREMVAYLDKIATAIEE